MKIVLHVATVYDMILAMRSIDAFLSEKDPDLLIKKNRAAVYGFDDPEKWFYVKKNKSSISVFQEGLQKE